MDKKEKKFYQSKKDYGKKWNTVNQNVSIDRELIHRAKSRLGDMTLKAYIESLIESDLGKDN